MNKVESFLNENKYSYVLKPREFVNIKPFGGDLFVAFVEDILNREDSKVLIMPDIDIDGFCSAKIMFDCLSDILPDIPDVYRHTSMQHGLTKAIVLDVIKKKYTHFVIVDSSSNDLELLFDLHNSGVRVCVIDHHNSNYSLESYPSSSVVLNNKISLRDGIRIPYKNASCGLLCAIYSNYARNQFRCDTNPDDWVYAVLSLYSDCMDTRDPFNVMVINYVRDKLRLPLSLRKISGKKNPHINRNVMVYSINPKINACLRLEMYQVIYSLFFECLNEDTLNILAKTISEANSEIKEYLKDLDKKLVKRKYGNIVTIDFSDESSTVYVNFKGLVANQVAPQESKVVIGYYLKNGEVLGSVRDPFNRDCLSLFKQFCRADGHDSAFGFDIPEQDFESLVEYVNNGLDELNCSEDKPSIISIHDIDPITLEKLCTYNEYSTTNTILLKFTVSPETSIITSTKYGYTVKSKLIPYKIISSQPICYGSNLILEPVLSTPSFLRVRTIGGF